jgi:hypothetical protein
MISHSGHAISPISCRFYGAFRGAAARNVTCLRFIRLTTGLKIFQGAGHAVKKDSEKKNTGAVGYKIA